MFVSSSPKTSFDRTKAGGTLMLMLCAAVFLVFAGYDAYRWHVATNSWQKTQAEFIGFQNMRVRRESIVGRQGMVKYPVNNKIYEASLHLSGEYVRSIRSLQPGESSAPVDIKVDPQNPEKVLADPRDDIWQQLTTAGWAFLIGVIWYALYDRVTQALSFFERLFSYSKKIP